MIPQTWLEDAAVRIKPHILQTELTYLPEADLYIKWENHQVTGSFKVRGAINKVMCLQDWERQRGLVAASAGNHGQGVALAGKLTGAKVTVFASDHAAPMKIEAMRNLGAEVVLVPGGYGDAEKRGLAFAAEREATWISPYNDGQVIAGQGTVGLEMWQDLPNLQNSTWVVPVGGGGLIAGIAASLEGVYPRPKLVGVQSEASPFFHSLFHDGTQDGVVELESLADGLAGPVEDGSVTIPLIQEKLDDLVLVSEKEIARAIAFSWYNYSEKIEGSAAAALAAVLFGKIPERPAVVLISGGNIQQELLERVIKEQEIEKRA